MTRDYAKVIGASPGLPVDIYREQERRRRHTYAVLDTKIIIRVVYIVVVVVVCMYMVKIF